MNVCDRLVVLNFGTKIAEGPTREVAQEPAVLEAYFGAGAAAGPGQ
jgi:ABC-type branched-subunit amino acid transport system ATPase component